MKKAHLSFLVFGAILTLLAAAGLVLTRPFGDGLPNPPIEHTRAASVPDNLQAPVSVTGVAWEWESPEESFIEEVLPVPVGAALVLNDGVVVLNGESGEELWRYRHPGAQVSVGRTPDRSVLALHIETGADDEEEAQERAHGRLLSLDSSTGKILGQAEVPGEEDRFTSTSTMGVRAARVSHLTDTGRLLMPTDPDTSLDLAHHRIGDDHPLWERNRIVQCPSPATHLRVEDVAASHERIALLYSCPDADGDDGRPGHLPTFLAGVDARTGEVDWQLEAGTDFADLILWSVQMRGGFIVLGNEARHRGSIVIDGASAKVVASRLGDGEGEQVLRVMDGEYLLARHQGPASGAGSTYHYEVRDFSGEVKKSFSADSFEVQEASTFLLPLEESLAKVAVHWEAEPRGPADTAEVTVFDWGSEGVSRRIPLDLDMHLGFDMGAGPADELLGPGSFTAVPGAVVLTEAPASGIRHKAVGLT